MNATYVTSDKVLEYFYNSYNDGASFTDTEGNKVTWEQYVDTRDKKALLGDDALNKPYAYGLTLANKNQRYEGGSSIQIDFDKTFGQKGIFRYRTTLYSFYGWINQVAQQRISAEWNADSAHANDLLHFESIVPTVRWENTIDIKASKYISTQLYFQLYYNKAQNKKIQTQTVLGVGLAYTFKNK